MKTVHFTARLLSDAVISERSATIGGHRCLDYLPGAVLLGAAAASLYHQNPEAAFLLFHSGKVRFGNAYPLSPDNQPTLPVPLCWHLPKGQEAADISQASNLIHATAEQFEAWDAQGEQQKQLRTGYVGPAGRKISPSRNYRLKTAINREQQGMAEEAHLFGYQSLAAGTCWYFSVSFDDGLEARLVEQVAGALSGVIRVGRSRSAEYGLLAVSRSEADPLAMQPEAGEQLLLYCLSDLALTDRQTGAPVLAPEPGVLQLDGITFNPGRSYLRTRSYAPFNSTRKRFDLERQVIVKGSVLVYERPGGFSVAELQQLQQRLACGIGSYRQDGLGQLLVNPPFLADASFAGFTASVLAPPPAAQPQQLPPLVDWLGAKAAQRSEEAAAVKQVDDWIRELISDRCPKNSQWGQLRSIAVQGKDQADIKAKLTKLCAEGVSQKRWAKQVKGRTIRTSYRDFILETVLDGSLSQVRKRLYLLGNRLPRLSNQRSNGGDQ